jgi:hypothetical protein
VTVDASTREEADPIRFSNLSSAEREVVRTALSEGVYVVQSDDVPQGLADLRDRIERWGTGLEEAPRSLRWSHVSERPQPNTAGRIAPTVKSLWVNHTDRRTMSPSHVSTEVDGNEHE